jgi:predicted dehydrogenase
MKIGIMSVAHHHAISYAAGLRAIPGLEMIGIADEDTARGRAFADRFGVRLFPSYEALLAERPAGVLVCSENARHRPLVELAARSGVHVMCEKPLATSVEDAQAMVDACERAGVILMTAFPMRFSAPLLEIKSMLNRDGLGRIYAVNGTNQGQVPSGHGTWFVDKTLAGGGSAMDHIVHLVDVLRWYLRSEVIEVYAQFNRIIGSDQVDVETGGLVLLTFANGTFATVDCSWSRPPGYPTWGGLTLELVGERGVVGADAFRQNLLTYGPEEGLASWLFWGSDADKAMTEEFLAAIRERRAPMVTGYDGLRAVEVVMAAYRSASLNQPVRLS